MNRIADLVGLIGVKAFQLPTKQEVILFDEIVVLDTQMFNRPTIGIDEADADFLTSKKAIRKLEWLELPSVNDKELDDFTNYVFDYICKPEVSITDDNGAFESLILRECCTKISIDSLPTQCKIVGLPGKNPFFYSKRSSSSRESLVHEVVVSSLPVPSEVTPWEQVLDFKNDYKARQHRIRLKDWVNKTIQSDIPDRDIKDEIETLVNDYEQYMNSLKIPFYSRVIRFFFHLATDLIAGTHGIPVRNTGDSAFQIVNHFASVSEKELSARGREVSYISLARKAF